MTFLFRFKHLGFLGTLIVLVLFNCFGCAEINHLREAQKAFSDTSAMENSLHLSTIDIKGVNINDTAQTEVLVRAGYASVLTSLDNINKTQQDKLKSDQLWGVVASLKAMTYWRLDQDAKAMAQAKDALDNFNDQLGPRDRAILTAIPGLIRNDQAFRGLKKIPGDSGEAIIQSPKKLLINAMPHISKARAKLSADHPMHTYLIQSQLIIYANLNEACNKLESSQISKCQESVVKEKCVAQTAMNDLKRLAWVSHKGLVDKWEQWTNLVPGQPCQ